MIKVQMTIQTKIKMAIGIDLTIPATTIVVVVVTLKFVLEHARVSKWDIWHFIVLKIKASRNVIIVERLDIPRPSVIIYKHIKTMLKVKTVCYQWTTTTIKTMKRK